MKLSRHRTARLVISGIAIGMPVAFAVAGCGGSSPGTSAPAATGSAAGRASAPAAAQASATASSVVVPKYVAAQNARKDVVASVCKRDGAKGWLLRGTATNSSSAARSYSIVVDFVSRKGDTVLDTKVVHVRRVAPAKSAHWSAVGAAGHTNVTCVIRQALGHA